MAKVTALCMDTITKKSNHVMTPCAVSVCITPAAPSPLPIPYPVVASIAEGITDPPMRTKFDGAIICTVGSCFKNCHGNEPGTLKEVVSLNTAGPCFLILGAINVFVELGMAGITGSPGFMNKAITVGASGSASGAGGAGGGGGSGSGTSASSGSPQGPSNQSGGGGSGGGSNSGSSADRPAPGESSAPPERHTCQNGHPVDMVSGCVVDQAVDLKFGSLMPIVFKRLYSSARRHEQRAALGPGWAHPFEQTITEDGNVLVLRDEEGRLVSFQKVQPGESTFHRRERLWLHVLERGYRIESLQKRHSYHFERFEADGPAYLRRITDGYNNAIELVYDDGRLHHITDPSGRRVELTWGRHRGSYRIDRLTVVARGHSAQSVRYHYNSAGCLITATDSCGHSDTYEYDDKRRMVTATVKNGTKFQYEYDEQTGRCSRTWGPKGLYRVPLQYDLDKHRTIAGGEEPRIYQWNALGVMTREATPSGIVLKERAFDADGYLIADVDGAGNGMRYWYDELGNVIRAIDAEDRVTAFEYAYGRPVKRTTPDGQVTQYSYDRAGSLIGVRMPNGAGYAIHRDERGRIVAVDGPSGRLAAYEYDAEHNLAAEWDERSQRTSYAYDAMGHATTRTDPLGRVTRVQYDALGQRTALIRPDGASSRFRRDAMGKVIERVDAMGHSWKYRYSGMGVLTGMTEPSGASWRLDYTSFERLKQVKSPTGESYSFEYDEAGRVITESTFDERTQRYQYTDAGLLGRIDYNDGSHRELRYDATHRLIEAQVSDGSRVHYRRDTFGRLESAQLQTSDGQDNQVVFQRDAFGRVIAEEQDGHWLRFEYDQMNRRTALALPDGSVTHYQYGVADDVLAVEHNGHRLDFRRDTAGRATQISASAGPADNRQERFILSQQFDAMDRVIEQRVEATHQSDTTAAAVMRRYEYDLAGRVTHIDDQRWGRTELAYDANDRLLSHISPQTREVFEYDGAGYMETALWQLSGEPRQQEKWQLGPGNRLLSTSQYEYEYDERGRRTHKRSTAEDGGTLSYQWNARNQLTQVTTADGRQVHYRYDALGRRLSKEVINADGVPASSTRFLWDNDFVCADVIDGAQRNFVYHPLSGVPLLQSQQGEVFTCVCDQVGVVKELIDPAGLVAWSGKYSAWGKLLDSQSDELSENQRGHEIDTPLRLRGQYYDEEAEIAYTRHRYFDADTCRWLSPDPIGLRGGRNLNSFNRSPTHVIDPLGLADGAPHGPSPAEQAAAWQGQGDYPGVDEWSNTTIPAGTQLVMGEPGPGGFMTTPDAVEGVGADQAAVWQGLQVMPHPDHGYRPRMGVYTFTEDTPAATATTLANPQHGAGGMPQYYVPGWESSTERTGQVDLNP